MFDRNALSLYLVTDRPLALGRDIIDVVLKAVKGGVTLVQLREKDLDTRHFVELAVRLRESLSGSGVPLIINDRLDVALAAGADGVHLGQTDMPYAYAREILGPDKIIGVSIENLRQAEEANGQDVDYIAVSPVYLTDTKTDTSAALGLEGVRRISSMSIHPCCGIGCMNRETAADVIRAGADGIAVVSAIMSAADPCAAATELRTIINDTKNELDRKCME